MRVYALIILSLITFAGGLKIAQIGQVYLGASCVALAYVVQLIVGIMIRIRYVRAIEERTRLLAEQDELFKKLDKIIKDLER